MAARSPIGLGQPSLLAQNGIGGLPTDPRIVVSSLNSQSVTAIRSSAARAAIRSFRIRSW